LIIINKPILETTTKPHTISYFLNEFFINIRNKLLGNSIGRTENILEESININISFDVIFNKDISEKDIKFIH